MENYNHKDIGTFINIGTGEDLTIKELAEMIKGIVGYKGELIFDTEKPDGTLRKLLDISLVNGLGWRAKTSLEDGVKGACEWYVHDMLPKLTNSHY